MEVWTQGREAAMLSTALEMLTRKLLAFERNFPNIVFQNRFWAKVCTPHRVTVFHDVFA